MNSSAVIFPASTVPQTLTQCFHCGEPCDRDLVQADHKCFCCTGCQTVYEILQSNNLCTYYDFDERAKLSFKHAKASRFEYLDDESVRCALLQFSDGVIARTTLRLPQIHCASCIWLLENLFKINPAILRSEVNFLKKEIALTFREQEVKLSEVVGLLTKLGYEPDIRLDSVAAKGSSADSRSLYLKIGLAGFAFGNVMLFAFPDYLDTTAVLSAQFKTLFAWLSIAFSTPVLLYSASDYFISSWYAFRQRKISLDVPVALGIAALYFRSLYDILTGVGTGYLDSFTGLVFFLLIGKLFQKKTFDALSFDRNYAAYFPLSVMLLKDGNERSVPVSKLQPGDEIFVRNRELVPADSMLQSARGWLDYSFVTGESEPVEIKHGDIVYAGARVVGAGAKLAVTKEVSHSYLTQLWNNEAFRKEKRSSLLDISDTFGKYFTIIVSVIAAVAALYWLPNVDKALSVFTAVLIIACPCALTLAAPFTLGAAVAIFGKAKFYLKNVGVVPDLAALNALVFDKTGTLTHAGQAAVQFDGKPLSEAEQLMIAACLQHSTHPLSRQILEGFFHHRGTETAQSSTEKTNPLRASVKPLRLCGEKAFQEVAGKGIAANIDGHSIAIGSAAWIGERTNTTLPEPNNSSAVHIELDGQYRGSFRLQNSYRTGLVKLFQSLQPERELYLLSGDNDHERKHLRALFQDGRLAFQQKPEDKLRFVQQLQAQHKVVGMIGDGLNDAGALQQSNVGIALTEDTSTFTPACDAILDAEQLHRLPVFIGFARYALRVLVAAFLLSLVYNTIGLTLAVTGQLSPLVTAIFMPLSSWSVVAVAWGAMKIREREIAERQN
ncbi:MAG TPA: heavy metal translocating P-type ATPase metal-binding domain-containing protein [Blastocatellia bacterium]|nr:heavy metal translocating P-type ATPase metal-binding domain-containing protein [Blastocatellia bacterium]